MRDKDEIQKIQNAILGLNCSDSLTLHEWAKRMKNKYGSPPFDKGNFIDLVGQAFIALHSQGYARQIVRDRSVNKSSKWQVILNSKDHITRTDKVYITRTGKKYHTYDCEYLEEHATSKIPIWLDEAQEDYGPCGICNP